MSRKMKQFLAVMLSLVTVLSGTFAAMAETMPAEADASEIYEAVAAEAADEAVPAEKEAEVEAVEEAAEELLGAGYSDWEWLTRALKGQEETWNDALEVTDDTTAKVRTIKLLRTITAAAEEGYLIAGKTENMEKIVLDLNGKTIDRALSEAKSDYGFVIQVAEGALLTVKDGVGGGKITGGKGTGTGTYFSGGGVHVDGTLILDGGSIEGNSSPYGGGVYVKGTFIMNGGTITNNRANHGVGVYVCGEGATLTMKGGLITKNIAEKVIESGNLALGGGGVYVTDKATFTMEDGTISENNATNGGGVYVGYNNGAVFTMKKGTINENVATSGAGVYLGIKGTFNLEEGTITGNTGSQGAGISLGSSDAVCVMTGGTISKNLADKIGGGVCVWSYEKFEMTGGTISENYGSEGGGIYCDNASNKGDLILGGTAVVQGNKNNATLSADDVFLAKDSSCKYVKLSTVKAPQAGMNVGITRVGQFTETCVSADMAKFFFADNSSGSVSYNAEGQYLEITESSARNITYSGTGVTFQSTDGGEAPKTAKAGDFVVFQVKADSKDIKVSVTEKSTGAEVEVIAMASMESVAYRFTMPDADVVVKATVNKKPDPTPSSDDDDDTPLFTGTWNNAVKGGTWTQDANGVWHFTSTETFRATWGYIVNPYAQAGQNTADWFWFDANGNMLTGWQLINGKWYYLNPTKDGTLGACLIGPARTPDGYEVDESGAWTGR